MRAMGLILFVGWCLTMLGGCAERSRDQIQSADPESRVRAIVQAAEVSDRQAVPLIVDRLDDEDEAVRVVAIEALRRLTGQDLGYRAYDPIYRRVEAVNRWHRWLNGDRIIVSTSRPSARVPSATQGAKE